MKKTITTLASAACLLCSATAHAGLYKLDFTATDFTATDFGAAAPQAEITGSILFTAESLTSDITAINSVDLVIAGHRFSVDEVGGSTFGSPGSYIFNAKLFGVGVQSNTDDFWIRAGDYGFGDFVYARSGFSVNWYSFTGTATFTEQLADVPEPGSLALLLAGVVGLGAQLCRRRK